MRRPIFALTASGCLASALMDAGRDLFGMGIPLLPRETGIGNAQPDATGWTPRPTEPPGRGAGLDLLKRGRGPRRRQDTDTWINDLTCGWFSESASESFTCESGFTCATNNQNVVGCVSGTSSAFYRVCLDYQAFLQSSCVSIGTATGCCTDPAYSECGMLLWADSPAKSMYRCFSEQTIISMIDQPRVVLDSLTRSTTSTTSTSSKPETTSSPTPSGTTPPNPPDDSDSDSTNIGAIVGGVVGGVAGLAAIAGLIAYLAIRRRGKKYSAVAPADPAPYSGQAASGPINGPPQAMYAGQSQQTSPQQMALAPGNGGGPFSPPAAAVAGPGAGATTYPPNSPYAQSIATMKTAYDPHQSYYDATTTASKPPGQGHVSPGQQFTAYQPPYAPPQPTTQASPPQQFQPQFGATPELESSMAGHHQGHMSELDSTVPIVGHQYNPAEMGVQTPRP